jgi:hypothetical protein
LVPARQPGQFESPILRQPNGAARNNAAPFVVPGKANWVQRPWSGAASPLFSASIEARFNDEGRKGVLLTWDPDGNGGTTQYYTVKLIPRGGCLCKTFERTMFHDIYIPYTSFPGGSPTGQLLPQAREVGRSDHRRVWNEGTGPQLLRPSGRRGYGGGLDRHRDIRGVPRRMGMR